MAQVTKTVDKTLVQGNEVFIYTVNVSYSGLTQPAQNGYLIDFFPSKIKYVLPQVGGQIQSITETPVAGGTEVRFNFGLVTSGTSLSFTIACSFGPGRINGDTFTNEARLYADQVLVATGVAPTVTLFLVEQFTLSKNIDGSILLRPGEERTITLSLINMGDFGAAINNVVISDVLPVGLSPVLSFLPVGNDVPFAGYSDPTHNGLTGTWSGNTLNFTLPSFRGVRYDIKFKVTVDNNVVPGQIIINTAKWTVNSVPRPDAVLNMRVFAPSDAFSFSKAGSRTGVVGGPITYGIANSNVDNVSYNNYVLEDTFPVEVDIHQFRFESSSVGLPTYSIFISLSGSPNVYIPIIVNGQGSTGNVDLTPFIPAGQRVAKLRLTAPVFNNGPTSYHSFVIFGVVNNQAHDGQTIINTATASADGISLTVTYSTIIDGRSDLSVTKALIPTLQAYFPLEEFKVQLAAGAPNTITVNPVIGDLLPVGIEYELGSEYFVYIDFESQQQYDSRNPGFPIALPSREIIDNYSGTGRRLVRWNFDNFILPSNNGLIVYFTAFVRIDAPDMFENIGFEGNPGDNVLFVYNAETDVLDLDGDGITDEIISVMRKSGVILTTSEFSLKKLVKGQNDMEFSSSGTTYAGGDVEYQLLVTNNQTIDLKNIEIVDILPYVGDTGVILTDESRGSQFDVYATGVVTAEIVNLLGDPVIPTPVITIEYSESNDPIRFDQLGNTIGTGTWSLTPPSNITLLRSIKVTTDPSVILKPYERLIVTIKAKAPVGAVISQVAYNSFAVRAEKIDGGVVSPLLPTEPNKVGVRIVSDLLSSIGQLVWLDTNGDGIYQPTEPGVNGVSVTLYNELLQPIASTVTSNNAGGDPGYYLFSGLIPGTYYVKFAPNLPYTLTIQQENLPNGSKPNPLTGFTSQIVLGVNEHRLDINAGILVPCTPPVIYAKDRCVRVGAAFNPLKGVHAEDCRGEDITEDIIVTQNTVDTSVEGLYLVTYSVTDELEQTTIKTITVVVCRVNPRQQAITDLLVSVALQEAAVAHIVNAEGEKIQKAAAMNFGHDDIIKINRSVLEMLKSLTKFELVLGNKANLFDCNLCSDGCCDMHDSDV